MLTMKKKLPKFYSKYTDDVFASAEEFEAFLHRGETLKYDYVVVAGVLYTMEEYDMHGETVIWANRKHNLTMSVDTSNRYSDQGYTDAKVLVYPANSWRNDITYAE